MPVVYIQFEESYEIARQFFWGSRFAVYSPQKYLYWILKRYQINYQ